MTTIDQKIAELLNNLVINGWPVGNAILCLIAILLSVALSGFIGFEREKRGRSAGLRTHLLVGVGSCIIMIISIYGFPSFEGRDIARLAAGVLAGVGFLGAGAIIHDHGSIKGLTTAGTIWLVMAIGLACGSFNFVIAIFSTFIVMVVLIFFRKVEHKINKHSPMLTIVTANDVPVMTILLEYSHQNNLLLLDVNSEIVTIKNTEMIQTTFKLVADNNAELDVNKLEKEIAEKTKAVSIQNLNRH